MTETSCEATTANGEPCHGEARYVLVVIDAGHPKTSQSLCRWHRDLAIEALDAQLAGADR